MATTVTYKGATLTTATNQTKTLKTAGKYMEDDVTITDVSEGGSAIVVTEETDETGGTNYIITAVDLSNDTVSPETLLSGYTAHNSSGKAITGTYSGGGGTINNQNKTVTPTESQQSVTADAGYTGLGTVTVNAISSTYVGSGVSRKTSSDLTSSGATVTAPAGYYASAASKSVATGSVTAPSSISGTAATVSTGTNTLTLTKTVSVTPNVTTAGYISSGTAGNASVSLTASVTTKAAATITPSTSEQSIAAGTYLTGKQTISAMPTGTAGTPTAAKGAVSNHSVSVTPSVTNSTGYITGGTKTGTAVTVSASELVSGSQTITSNGTVDVTNLASVVVACDYVTYYTGTTTPSSSLGSNGDIYLKTS